MKLCKFFATSAVPGFLISFFSFNRNKSLKLEQKKKLKTYLLCSCCQVIEKVFVVVFVDAERGRCNASLSSDLFPFLFTKNCLYVFGQILQQQPVHVGSKLDFLWPNYCCRIEFSVKCDFKPQQMRRTMMNALFEFMIRCREKQAERKIFPV